MKSRLAVGRKIPAVLSWHFPDFAYHSSMDQVSNVCAREMKNAGVSIGTAAFQLSMGSEGIARSILQTVSVAWKKRLELGKTQLKEELEETQSQGSQAFEVEVQRERDELQKSIVTTEAIFGL